MGVKEEGDAGEDVMGVLAAGMAGERGPSMYMEGLRQDIPDGELLPAAAATVALESCFLGGNRDRTMSIVWQVRELRGSRVGGGEGSRNGHGILFWLDVDRGRPIFSFL